MRLFLLTLVVGFCASGWAAEPAVARASALGPAKGDEPAATLARIRDAALKSDWALRRLAELTDKVGPRLSGSVQAQAAVTLTANALKAAGLRVSLQPVVVPHWVRGEERGEVVDYPGRPAGVTQRLSLTALGGSSPTGPEGLTAPVLVVRSLAELERRAAEAKGKIVLVSVPFDQNLADNGEAGKAYSQGTEARFKAPAASAAVGAAASLVRSVGGADFRLPHTGFTRPGLDGGATAIPAAALTTEDALLLERLAAEGPVVVKLTLTPQTLPDVESSNVIAELPGREKADEVVVVSGHLDSWDLGTGALDDGAGVSAALGAVQLLKSLGLAPRRTIRAVAFMNEENGVRGGAAYAQALGGQFGTHVAAIEADSGAGRPLGLLAFVTPESVKRLDPIVAALRPLGATVVKRVDSAVGADISALEEQGVPGLEPLLDGRTYFHYHHTPADTFDKVDPEWLRRQVAVLAVMAYALADEAEPLPRVAPKPGPH